MGLHVFPSARVAIIIIIAPFASRHCGNLSIFWKIQKTTQGSGKKTHGKFLPSGVSFSSVCLHVALCVFGVCILCVYCVCASWRRERLFFSCCCRDMDTRKMVGLSATRMPPVSYSHGRTRRTREVTSLGNEKRMLSIVTLRRFTLIWIRFGMDKQVACGQTISHREPKNCKTHTSTIIIKIVKLLTNKHIKISSICIC